MRKGAKLPTCAYAFLVIPYPDKWTLIINKNTVYESGEIARVPMLVRKLSAPVENLTISFDRAGEAALWASDGRTRKPHWNSRKGIQIRHCKISSVGRNKPIPTHSLPVDIGVCTFRLWVNERCGDLTSMSATCSSKI
jgi:Protein of unknown function (DUF2911)